MTTLDHIGTYRRELPVTLERLYENAIDWEHLPYLHKSSFARIECVHSGLNGFRAWVWPRNRPEGPPLLLELKLDRERRRWVSRTIEGLGAGSEIVTDAIVLGDRRTEVVVDFFVPGIAPNRLSAMRTFFFGLYTQLYDEDVSMMTLRQARLDASRDRASAGCESRTLGVLAEVRRRLPMVVDTGEGAIFKLVELDGELVAYPTVCPHMLGPLGDGTIEAGIVECPWHGYRFDLRTGECLRGGSCRLTPAPRITVDPTTMQVKLESRFQSSD